MAGERNFTEEQLQGLREIGYTFVIDVRAITVPQLREEQPTQFLQNKLFAMPWGTPIPETRQVAVNPNQIALPGSDDLNLANQIALASRANRSYKASRLNSWSLRGINFGIDRASATAQLDIKYWEEHKEHLLQDLFRTIDIQYEHSDERVIVGHPGMGNSPLNMMSWSNAIFLPYLRVALVATPAGSR